MGNVNNFHLVETLLFLKLCMLSCSPIVSLQVNIRVKKHGLNSSLVLYMSSEYSITH